jgi:type II secretory pathway pseudopilin PulG
MNTARTHHAKRQRHACTLVELLVVVAFLAVFGLVAFASAVGSRVNAQSAVSLGNLRTLTQGQLRFANDNDQALAGPNSSGLRWNADSGAVASEWYGDSSPTTPTTRFDWISPTVGDDFNFSANRAERTADILELLADPRATRKLDGIYAGDDPLDVVDFVDVFAERGIRQVSYLAPSATLLWSPPRSDDEFFDDYARVPIPGVPGETAMAQWTLSVPVDFTITYRARLDQIGDASVKVAVAEGTRYLSNSSFLDINIDGNPRFYSWQTASTPIRDDSTAYGRAFRSNDNDNVELSVRYPNQTFHVARFDGSAALESLSDAYGAVEWWYPSGTTFTGIRATPEALDRFQPGDIIP